MSLQNSSCIILNRGNNSNTDSSKPNVMNFQLPTPFVCYDYEIALANLYIYNSWFNVIGGLSNYNDDNYSIAYNGVTTLITMPDGNYSINDIGGYLQLQLDTLGYYLTNTTTGVRTYYQQILTNTVYYSAEYIANPVPASGAAAIALGLDGSSAQALAFIALAGGYTPQLITGSDNFYQLIGALPNTSYPASATTTTLYNTTFAPGVPNIALNANAINVQCNLTFDSRFNTSPQTIYTFSSNVAFGSQIQIIPPSLIWYSCLDGTYQNIIITFQSADDNSNLPIRDQNIICSLIIRKKAKYITQ